MFESNPGHKWIQFYQADLVDSKFYQLGELIGTETAMTFVAWWIECDRFQSKELYLVPEICLSYL